MFNFIHISIVFEARFALQRKHKGTLSVLKIINKFKLYLIKQRFQDTFVILFYINELAYCYAYQITMSSHKPNYNTIYKYFIYTKIDIKRLLCRV